MIRRIALCLTFALTAALLGFGCGQGKKGVTVPDTRTEEQKEKNKPAPVPKRVEGLILQIQQKDAPKKRIAGANAAGRLADNPDLTADLKAKLIDALKKAVESDQDADAKKAENEALGKLQGAGG